MANMAAQERIYKLNTFVLVRGLYKFEKKSLAFFCVLIGGLMMCIAVILPFWKEPDYEGVVDRK